MLEDPWQEERQAGIYDRNWLRYLVAWLAFVLGMVVFGALLSLPALAQVLYRADAEGLTIMLMRDTCKLREVANLPNRAIWQEHGKAAVEGCYGYDVLLGVVLTYWSDRTIVALPGYLFKRVQDV
jgi:hypothetical protein